MYCSPAVCLLSGYRDTCQLTNSNTIRYLNPTASNRRSDHEFHSHAASEFDRHPGDEIPRYPGGWGGSDRLGS